MFRIQSFTVILSLVVLGLGATSASTAFAHDNGCCTPPPVQIVLSVQPPCSPCLREVTVCVPASCTEAPTVCWKKGLFGRQIGTYTWACCGHTVKVVVNRRGDVKVRG